MGDRCAFFYGTLMAPQVLHRVCYGTSTPTPSQSDSLTVHPAILHSYSRRKVRYCDYPAIIPSANATVRGTFVRGLTGGDIWRLDIFEGDEYVRKKVKLRMLKGTGDGDGIGVEEAEKVEAETYVWAEGAGRLEEGEWNFAEFVRDKMRRWVGGKDEVYEEVDEAVRSAQQDPTGGRFANGKITEDLRATKEEALKSAV